MKIAIPFLFALCHAANTGAIKCYECSYQISEDGDESGSVDCLTVTDSTHEKTFSLNKEHMHHGKKTFSRTDCAIVKGEGINTIVDKGHSVQYKFTFVHRHSYTNYDDAETYNYEGMQTGIDFRQKLVECGSAVNKCVDPVNFPIYLNKKVKREVRQTQMCPVCQKEEYMSTETNSWVMSDGHDSCDSAPGADHMFKEQCGGICNVQQDEFMLNGQDYKRTTNRWCYNTTATANHPDWDITATINTNAYMICQGDLCNTDANYNYAIINTISGLLLIFVMVF